LGLTVNAACLPNYYTSNIPQRICQDDGTWTTSSSDCAAVFCASGSNSSSTWPSVQAGTTTHYDCKSGFYSANTTTTCYNIVAEGYYTLINCTAVYCSTGNNATATWLSVQAGNLGNFTCLPGYFASNASVACSIDGYGVLHPSWGDRFLGSKSLQSCLLRQWR